MNKSLHTLIILAFLTLGASNACADDDTVRCSGTVTYEGVSYDVSKNDESEIEAKSELVEVACEEACRGSLLENSCERACEKSAILSAVTCTHSARPARVRCTASVQYEDVAYDVDKIEDSEIEAKSELIEQACDIACHGSLLEDACEHTCEKKAILTNVKCREYAL